jgi:hypothetical protein
MTPPDGPVVTPQCGCLLPDGVAVCSFHRPVVTAADRNTTCDCGLAHPDFLDCLRWLRTRVAALERERADDLGLVDLCDPHMALAEARVSAALAPFLLRLPDAPPAGTCRLCPR